MQIFAEQTLSCGCKTALWRRLAADVCWYFGLLSMWDWLHKGARPKRVSPCV